LILLPFWV